VVDDSAHALTRAIDMRNVRKAPRLQRNAGQRLVADRRRPASLGDKDLVRHVQPPPASVGVEPARSMGGKALGGARVTRKPAREGGRLRSGSRRSRESWGSEAPDRK